MPGGWDESRDDVNKSIATLNADMLNVKTTLNGFGADLKAAVEKVYEVIIRVAVIWGICSVLGSAIAVAATAAIFRHMLK